MAIILHRHKNVIFFGGASMIHQMRRYGTQCMAMVGDEEHGEIPAFRSVRDVVKKIPVDIAVVASDPDQALDHIMEAADSSIPMIICMSEQMPLRDYMTACSLLPSTACCIGPGSFGVISPGAAKIGDMPDYLFRAAEHAGVGIVSRSSVIAYEVAGLLTQHALGQTTCVGIGPDMDGSEIIRLFDQDPQTAVIIVIDRGEMQISTTKPVIVYQPGHSLHAKTSAKSQLHEAADIMHIVDIVLKLNQQLHGILS